LSCPAGAQYHTLHPGETAAEALRRRVSADNLERLRHWCMVGSDVENGNWAIYGARLGCAMAALEGLDRTRVSDFDWVADLWREQARRFDGQTTEFAKASARLADRLNDALSLDLAELDAEASRRAREGYVSPHRIGRIGPSTAVPHKP
jgi:hypothetical protein